MYVSCYSAKALQENRDGASASSLAGRMQRRLLTNDQLPGPYESESVRHPWSSGAAVACARESGAKGTRKQGGNWASLPDREMSIEYHSILDLSTDTSTKAKETNRMNLSAKVPFIFSARKSNGPELHQLSQQRPYLTPTRSSALGSPCGQGHQDRRRQRTRDGRGGRRGWRGAGAGVGAGPLRLPAQAVEPVRVRGRVLHEGRHAGVPGPVVRGALVAPVRPGAARRFALERFRVRTAGVVHAAAVLAPVVLALFPHHRLAAQVQRRLHVDDLALHVPAVISPALVVRCRQVAPHHHRVLKPASIGVVLAVAHC